MTALLRPTTSVSFPELFKRAEELGIPCWWVDDDLNVLFTPAPDELDAKLHTAVLDAARDCKLDHEPRYRNEESRLHLLALPVTEGVIVADLSQLADNPLSREQLMRVLRNYHRDLARASDDLRTLDNFSASLSRAYEEVNLLFRMARSLTSADEASRVVQVLSEELREVLCYGWLAVAFEPSDLVLEQLRGVMFYSGQLPCSQEEVRGHCSTLAAARTEKIFALADELLAARTGGELIAERVMHDQTTVGIVIAGHRLSENSQVSSGELRFAEAAAGFLGLFLQNSFRFAEQRRLFLGTLNALTAAVDAKDPYTRGHSERVALLSAQLAGKLGYKPEIVEAIRTAGLLHDIGKIGIPEAVLRKPARLTNEEFRLIKQHPEIGHRILHDLPSLSFQLPGILHHHERWDGGGYPHQLCGQAIPMVARILALADTFDAMSSDRSYRNAIPRERVLDEIGKSSGRQFDPDLVGPFLCLNFSDFDRLLASAAAA